MISRIGTIKFIEMLILEKLMTLNKNTNSLSILSFLLRKDNPRYRTHWHHAYDIIMQYSLKYSMKNYDFMINSKPLILPLKGLMFLTKQN